MQTEDRYAGAVDKVQSKLARDDDDDGWVTVKVLLFYSIFIEVENGSLVLIQMQIPFLSDSIPALCLSIYLSLSLSFSACACL